MFDQSRLQSTYCVSIVVVDNKSSNDDTLSIVETFKDTVCLPQSENLGFGRANNIGISYALQADADYVFLLNQDAYIYRDTIEKLVKCAQQDDSFGILSPLHLNGDATRIDPLFLVHI